MADYLPPVDVVESTDDTINRLISELSLGTNFPIGAGHRSLLQASAAAKAVADITTAMDVKELRNYDWLIDPLIELLKADIYNPAANKAAFGLKTLMYSRVCMSYFLDGKNMAIISKVLDIVLSKNTTDLKVECANRSLVENLAIIYREVTRFYPWDLVNVGGIRHCVLLLRYGDTGLKTIAASVMASLSTDLEICKQMFSYGAIKPLLLSCDLALTNEACMLAGLGCVTQLCRIPEIGLRMVQQGAVPILEKGLHLKSGHGFKAIKEKAVYSFAFLSKVDGVKSKLMNPDVIKGLYHEFMYGTMSGKITIIQLFMNVHNRYDGEPELVRSIQDELMQVLKYGPWLARNIAIKAICVLYDTLDDRARLVRRGIIESIFDVIESKGRDLQEAPLVCMIYLCVHPEVPKLLLDKGAAKLAAELLFCKDHIIKEVAVILLKSLNLYDADRVKEETPPEKQYMLVKDEANPQEYGGEYGGMVQEFLQKIVMNRRKLGYLREMLEEGEADKLGIDEGEMQYYENTFMQLDVDCGGTLDIDELKILLILMGERFDEEELQLLLDEYDDDKSGSLDFREFIIMMKGWDTRFGTGFTKWYNIKTKRGAIGKARRKFHAWWHRDSIEHAQVQEAKERRKKEKVTQARKAKKFVKTERLYKDRENATVFREKGLDEIFKYEERDDISHEPLVISSQNTVVSGMTTIVALPPIDSHNYTAFANSSLNDSSQSMRSNSDSTFGNSRKSPPRL